MLVNLTFKHPPRQMADSSEIHSKADAELQRSKRDQQDSSFLDTLVPIPDHFFHIKAEIEPIGGSKSRIRIFGYILCFITLCVMFGSFAYYSLPAQRVSLESNARILRVYSQRHVDVIILGDSLSRNIVVESCEETSGATLSDWTKCPTIEMCVLASELKTFFEATTTGLLSYRNGMPAGLSCCGLQGGEVCISQLHLYGMADSGPYYNGFVNTPTDPWTDTPLRICKALEIFHVKKIPTHIILAIMDWDLMTWDEKATSDAAFVEVWKDQLSRRIMDVKRCKDNSSELLLQTFPRNPHFADRIQLLNDVIRDVGKSNSLRLIDWQNEACANGTCSNADYRDDIHPNRQENLQYTRRLMDSLTRSHRDAQHFANGDV